MTYGTFGALLRAAFDRVVNQPLGAAMDAALSKLDLVGFGGPGASDCDPDGGDTADPVAVLERRVVASREG